MTVKGNKEIEFTFTEFEILLLLAQNAGMVFSKEKIYNLSLIHIYQEPDTEEKIEQLTQYSMLEQYDGDVLSNIIAVSYTHLDVYKRQIYIHASNWR